MSLFLAVTTTALFLVVGLVVDGGAKIRAAQHAHATAEEAARAAAQAVDAAAVLRGETVRIDPARAAAEATAYLDATGATGTAHASSPTTVTITVTETRPTVLLSLIGIHQVSATATATARIATSTTAEHP
ncbi:hypothetical protein NI17_010465 [Thermobifida halotolerans]|uniref:Putative Flp pilus-assembly TadG-like N-terminal domain-containing protein n=2 Tax=Thermobifida halotolerans TaxID=483545 RepID=A0AA97M1E1_9ACTN|nr:hypothetical protein NI17_010465 [Thermobifida halotolerans]